MLRSPFTVRVSAGGNPQDVPLSELAGEIDTVAGATYSIKEADYNRIKDFSSGSAVTVTIPVGLPFPFLVGISQGGAGQVTVVAATGVTLNSSNALVASAAQYDLLTLVAFAANSYRLFGSRA